MSAVAITRAAPPLPAPSGASSVVTARTTLLPPSHDSAVTGPIDDALVALYSALASIRDTRMRVAQGHVELNRAAVDRARAERADALARAQREAEKGGLFDWIAKDVGVAGAVGLVTFQYALVAADVGAHETELARDTGLDVVDGAALAIDPRAFAVDVLVRKTNLTPEDVRRALAAAGVPEDAPGLHDRDVAPVAKKLVVANVAIAGAAAGVLSGGSTTALTIALVGIALSASGQWVASSGALDGPLGAGASRWIGLGMEIAGAASSAGAGLVPGGGALAIAQGARSAAGRAASMPATFDGTDHIVGAVHARAQADAEIDAREVKSRLDRLDRALDLVLAGAREAGESFQRTARTLEGCLETNRTTLRLLAGRA